MFPLVELVGRYSKLPDPPKLPQFPTSQYGHKGDSGQDTAVVRRVHAIERRLEPAIIQQLAHDYEAGLTSIELMERYGLGKGTVLGLLREHGVEVRRQRLSTAQIDEAIHLYAASWSLARIGQRMDCAHTVVRKALLDRGVAMRPRRGWKY